MKKTMIGLFLLALPLLAAAPAARAQSSFGVAWSLGLPTGNTSDFAPGLSARGVSMDWRTQRSHTLSYGASIGWNIFNEADQGTFDNGTLAVTANRWRYLNAVPIYASVFRYFGSDRRSTRWYAGLNAGTMWIEQRTEMASYAFEEQNWHLAVAPEVGVQLPWDAFVGYLAVRYNVGFSAGEVDTQGWFDLRVGFGLD